MPNELGNFWVNEVQWQYHFLQVFLNTYFTLHLGYKPGCLLGIWRSSDYQSRDVMGILPQGTFGTRRHFPLSWPGQDADFPYMPKLLLNISHSREGGITSSGPYSQGLGSIPTLFYTLIVLFTHKLRFFFFPWRYPAALEFCGKKIGICYPKFTNKCAVMVGLVFPQRPFFMTSVSHCPLASSP